MEAGCRDELAVGRSTRADKARGGADPMLVGWGTDSLRGERTKGGLHAGEWRRGELVGRKRTRNDLLCGASGAGESWLGASGVFFSFFSSSL